MEKLCFDIDKSQNNPILLNNNKTVTFNQGSGAIALNSYINKNKHYLEIKVEKVGEAPFIGIFNNDIYKNELLNGNYAPYNNNDNMITTKVYEIKNKCTISLKIDCHNKNIIILNDNKELLNKNFNFKNVNIIIGVGSSGGSGGGGTFKIIEKQDIVNKYSGYSFYTDNYIHLLKQNDSYYSIKPEFYKDKEFIKLPINKLSKEDFKNYGFTSDELFLYYENKKEKFKFIDIIKMMNKGLYDILIKEL